jgi:hypothetical protein
VLLEVGTSPGLCSLVDRYGYQYGHEIVGGRLSWPEGGTHSRAWTRAALVYAGSSFDDLPWGRGVLDPSPVSVHDIAGWCRMATMPALLAPIPIHGDYRRRGDKAN